MLLTVGSLMLNAYLFFRVLALEDRLSKKFDKLSVIELRLAERRHLTPSDRLGLIIAEFKDIDHAKAAPWKFNELKNLVLDTNVILTPPEKHSTRGNQ